MKVIKSNSKTRYDFCGTNKLSFKERILTGNSFIPTKQDMSVDVREPGNSFVYNKRDMSKQEQPKQQKSNSGISKSELVGVNRPVTFGKLIRSLSNLGKNDFSKSEVKYDQQCLNNYEEIGIPREEAKKKKYGCQVTESKPKAETTSSSANKK